MQYQNMSLYFADNIAQLFRGDARNLNEIKNDSVDMILADVPYGVNYITGHRERHRDEKGVSKNVIATLERFDPIVFDKNFPAQLLKESFYEMYRVLRENTAVYIFTRWDVYPKLLPLLQEVFTVRNILTWGKDNWTAGDKDGNYAYQTEWIVYCTKGDHKLLGKRPTNLLLYKRVGGKELLHPAQKPTGLLSFLITKSCPDNGIVLDPFCGVASTAVAASNVGIRSICLDVDEKWLELGRKRLEHKLLPLFDLVEVQDKNFEMVFEGEDNVP